MQIDAIKLKIDRLFCNKIFKINLFLEKQQLIIAKFVFNVKYKRDETILKYKNCLVARSFIQIYEIDYKETFAPIVKYKTLRLLLAAAAKLGWHIYWMDVVAVFSAGKLHKQI